MGREHWIGVGVVTFIAAGGLLSWTLLLHARTINMFQYQTFLSMTGIVLALIVVGIIADWNEKEKRKQALAFISKPSPSARAQRHPLMVKPKSVKAKDETVVYGIPTMDKSTPSIRLPSGDIRCDNCGIVNRSEAKYCKNCRKILQTS